MASIAEKYSKFVYITSDNPRFEDPKNIVSNIVKGFKNKSYKIDLNRKNAIKDAIEKMDDNDILLILGKGRENYELIKNKKIYHNDVEIIQNFA
jgi:UDP-N-acetylmuramoyl-L-alanyl-D-glutamate--2,6-diaminopimelate ligase